MKKKRKPFDGLVQFRGQEWSLFSRNRIPRLAQNGTLSFYQIREIFLDSTFYKLEELDGTHLKAAFAGNRLFSCFDVLVEDRIERHNMIRVRDALEAPEGTMLVAEESEEDLWVEDDGLNAIGDDSEELQKGSKFFFVWLDFFDIDETVWHSEGLFYD